MLLDIVKKDVVPVFYINTGTLYDYLTGKFRYGLKNTWVLDGGLPQCMGLSGRSQTYKSGTAGTLFARALSIHQNSEGMVYETEGAISGPERYDDFVGPFGSPVSNRIIFRNSTDYSLTGFYDDFVKITDEKLKHAKDYTVESPFINPATNKPWKIMTPTFFFVDSFSRARSDKSNDLYDENSVDDSAFNMSAMADGAVKTRVMNDLPNRAARSGCYVILTAHVGNKMDLNPYAPTPKQLQYMKGTDSIKGVSNAFVFLTTSLLQTIKATVLKNKDKQCEYPASFSTDNEVNEVETCNVRCKNNAAGTILHFVISQYQGILDSVTNFHFLRNNKNWGLNVFGNQQEFSTYLTPDIKFSKKTLRNITDKDYAVARGLELTAQLCFIQTLCSTWKMPEYVHMKPLDFAERLMNSGSESVNRVLQSTGVWSTGKQERERLTIMDVLAFLAQQKEIPANQKK